MKYIRINASSLILSKGRSLDLPCFFCTHKNLLICLYYRYGGGSLDQKHIIALDGGKNRKKDSNENASDKAKLIIEGEEFELSSFVLSGEGPEGRRMLFNWNCSLDEMISYTKVLDVMINKKIGDAIND